jgi:hypothetical protein
LEVVSTTQATAGDYFEVQATQTSGGNLATIAGNDYTWLQARWIGRRP